MGIPYLHAAVLCTEQDGKGLCKLQVAHLTFEVVQDSQNQLHEAR